MCPAEPNTPHNITPPQLHKKLRAGYNTAPKQLWPVIIGIHVKGWSENAHPARNGACSPSPSKGQGMHSKNGTDPYWRWDQRRNDVDNR